MLDSKLEKEYRRLERPVKRHIQAKKRATWLSHSTWIVYLGAILGLVAKFYVSGNLDFSFEETIILGGLLLYVFASFFLSSVLRDRANSRRPDADDWLLYHTCRLLENLSEYHKDVERSGLKEEYRKNAIVNAKELLATVKRDWKLGDFRLARTAFGSSISELSDNLSKRVIPSLEKENEETIKKVESVLYHFAQYLLLPQIETLKDLNKIISRDLIAYESPVSEGYLSSDLLKHATIIGLILSASIAPILVGSYFETVTINTALIAFSAIFGPSIAVYFSYVLTKRTHR